MWMFLLFFLAFVVTFGLIIRFIGGTDESQNKESIASSEDKESIASRLKSFVPSSSLPAIMWLTLILVGIVTLFYFWDPVKLWVTQSDVEHWSQYLLDHPVLTMVQNNYGWIGLFMLIVGMNAKKLKWMKSVGGLLILCAFFFSGYGSWLIDTVRDTSTVLSCDVDPDQPKCLRLEEERANERALERQQAVAQARHQAQLQAVRQAAKEAAKPIPKRVPDERKNDCGGRYKNFPDCKSIVFHGNEIYDHAPPIGHCSVGDGPIKGKSLGSRGMMRWTPVAPIVRGQVFALKIGESFGGFTCRA